MSTTTLTRQAAGRPPVTSHAAIEAAAFALFESNGFDQTTTDDIAERVGVGRRTLFRYFPSKFDIPWGQFDASLASLRDSLESMPATMPLWQAVQQAVVTFNRFDTGATEQHRIRMRLILQTPSLQAHSVLMYRRWREVIANYVAQRTLLRPDALLPRTVGHVSLALAISAYEQWLIESDMQLEVLLSQSLAVLRSYFDHE